MKFAIAISISLLLYSFALLPAHACSTCRDAVADVCTIQNDPLCPADRMTFQALKTCACDAIVGSCASACQEWAVCGWTCPPGMPTPELTSVCSFCINQACASELMNCA